MKFEQERGLGAMTETLVWPEVAEHGSGEGGCMQKGILDLQLWMEENCGPGLGRPG